MRRRYADVFRVKLTFFDNPLEREWEGRRVRIVDSADLGRLKWVETLEAEKAARKRALIVHPSASTDYLDTAVNRGREQGIPAFLGTV